MDLSKFRNETIPYIAIIALIVEVVSLFFIGPSLLFSIGLAVGTACSVLGFLLLVESGKLVAVTNKSSFAVHGYIIRLIIYAACFLVSIKFGIKCGAGCGFGLLTTHFGILLLHGIVYPFIKKEKNPLNDWTEPKEWNDLSIYDDDDDEW
ncbi:MAG: hypothetical protein Q4B78_02200 [Bacillota bacterium]|nr:hypothetical protein [Bacillota bacterium]